MTNYARPDEFDSLMADWFDRDAEVRPPEELLAATLERTARTRPLPAWRLPERWLPLATIAVRRPSVPRGAYLLIVIAILVVAFAAALVLYVGSHKLPPLIGPAANGRIAYIAGGQLYTADTDGTHILQLTTGSTLKNEPAFSNDGTRILYWSYTAVPNAGPVDVKLNVANADGTDARVLLADVSNTASNPRWSPDGRFIAMSSAADGAVSHLYVVAVDGSGVKDLGDFAGAGASSPSWSQDGQRLAVLVGQDPYTQHIWIVNRDGSKAQQISKGSYKEVGEWGGAAEWSLDGALLLFSAGDNAGYKGQYIVGLDGAPERPVDSCVCGGLVLDASGDDGVWAPDGSRFAYLKPGTGDGPSIVIADRTGKTIRLLAGPFSWHKPVWSPDGTMIAIADEGFRGYNQLGGQVTVILDAVGHADPVIIPGFRGVDPAGGDIGMISVTWQRLAP
jgi:Tol biopolymer transport system component